MLTKLKKANWKERIAYVIVFGVVGYVMVFALLFDPRWGILAC